MENVKYQIEKRLSKKNGYSYYCLVIYFEYKGKPQFKLYPIFEKDLFVNDILSNIAVEVK